MVPIQSRIVGEDFRWCEKKRRAAQSPITRLTGEQNRRQTDAITPKPFAQIPVRLAGGSREMSSRRLQPADLFPHGVCKSVIACAEANDHGLGIFAEEREQPPLEPVLQLASLSLRSGAAGV